MLSILILLAFSIFISHISQFSLFLSDKNFYLDFISEKYEPKVFIGVFTLNDILKSLLE